MAYSLDDLLYLMSRLRDPDGGCPWDLAQDFKSITPSTIEEAYELVDAIAIDDNRQIKEELGDVLFQVIFYSQLGKERQWFEFHQIVDSLTDKLIRRHPHVFPNGELTARFNKDIAIDEVKQQWEAIKQAERNDKQQHRILDDIPLALPALSRAQKMQKRVAQIGFDWPDAISAIVKIREEINELELAIEKHDIANIKEEIGDLLFSCVNVARHLKVDPESALAASNRKFAQRFNHIEEILGQQGKTPETATLQEMDSLWQQAKDQS